MIARRSFLRGMVAMTAGAGVGPERGMASPPGPAVSLASDPLRPQYHLLPPANWMNDPNGPIYWNGEYHMFYQYNPDGAYWGDMHWGHAISPDMVHWHHLPVALAPTPGGPDASGCFTGTAVVQNGRVVILYTGVRASSLAEATIRDLNAPLRESQCLAVAADPDLKSWEKLAAPVLDRTPAGLQVNGLRDPSPWRRGERWYMVAASGLANRGGAVLLYSSADLRSWEYLHPLAGRDLAGDGRGAAARLDAPDPWEVWECPEFFAIEDWHVLLYSTAGRVYWQSGRLDEREMRFHPEQAGILDYGSYYAAKTQLDRSGRRIVWGWVQETRPVAEHRAAGWAGLMSLPRVLTVSSDGRLRMRTADEVDQLRHSPQALSLTADEEGNLRRLDALRLPECCGEIRLRARRGAGSFALELAGSSSGAPPWLIVGYEPGEPESVSVDGRPLPLPSGEHDDLDLRIHVDGSVIELIGNEGIAWTRRFYYSGSSPQDMVLRWRGRTSVIAGLDLWRLSPISRDRLTT